MGEIHQLLLLFAFTRNVENISNLFRLAGVLILVTRISRVNRHSSLVLLVLVRCRNRLLLFFGHSKGQDQFYPGTSSLEVGGSGLVQFQLVPACIGLASELIQRYVVR